MHYHLLKSMSYRLLFKTIDRMDGARPHSAHPAAYGLIVPYGRFNFDLVPADLDLLRGTWIWFRLASISIRLPGGPAEAEGARHWDL